MSPTTRPLESIQALRALAALLVVGYHARYFLNAAHAGAGDLLLGRGAIGVDIFFVISGFIIEYSTPLEMRDGLKFFARRLIRIAPLYYLATAVELIVSDKARDLGKLAYSAVFLPVQPTGTPYFGYPSLLVGWSLSFEMLFYTLFAVAIAVAGRWRSVLVAALLLAAVLSGQIVSSQPWSLSASHQSSFPVAILNLAADPLVIEFAIGMGLAQIFRLKWTVAPRVAIASAVTATAVLAVYLWAPLHLGSGPIYWGIPATLLVGSALLCERAWRIPRNIVTSPLGDSSYSLYLFHIPLLGLLGPPLLHLHRAE